MSKIITLNIPFTYELGEEGDYTGKTLETIEDCLEEMRAEIDDGILDEQIMVTTIINKEEHTFFI
jgi:hypothetical protein